MAVTQNTYTGDGLTVLFSFTFPYLETTDVKVSLNGTVTTAYTFANATTIQFNTAPANGVAIRIYRETDDSDLSATFYPGSAIRSQDLNENFTQNLYSTQEVKARYLDRQSGQMESTYVPTTSTSLITKGYMETNYGVIDEVGFTRWRQTASAAQTTFTGAGSYGGVLSYVPTKEQVYLNGALQQRDADYTASNGSSIVFNIALTVGDVVDVVCVNNLTASTVSNASNISYSGQFTGQSTRTVSAKLADVVSVKDFGAGGDGVADDTAAINATITASTVNSVILFPPGTYKLLSDITVVNRLISAHGASFTGSGKLIAPVTETLTNFTSRKGTAVATGLPADILGAGGKGGILIGGGHDRSQNGTWLSCDGATNWLSVLPSKNENPQELIVYNSSSQGYATTVPGSGAITRVWGTSFNAAWVGKTIYFLRKKFKVASVASGNSLTVTELNGSPVTFPSPAETEAYNYFYTSGSGLCNVSGSTVTFVSGDPFVPLFFTDFEFTLNGSPVTVSTFNSSTQYTLASPATNGTNVPFTWRGNVNDQLSILRVQSILGENEENINLLTRAGDNFLGRYHGIEAGFAGTYGQFRPLFIGSGSYTDFSYQHQIGCHPRTAALQGYVSLGGVQGREGLRVYVPNASTTLVNRISTQGAAAGVTPAFKSEGSDANINFGIDTKGTGSVNLTQDFTRNLFQFTGGNNAVNWFTSVASGTTFAPALRATGSDTNISFGIDTKGTGELAVTQSFARTIFKAQSQGTSAVNWLNVLATNTNTAVQLYASGSDSNIDILIQPKGTGLVSFGTYTGTVSSITGFITVKDSLGNTRKLAVVS